MSREKGNAIFVTIMVLGLMLHSNLAHGMTYTVGDSRGWDFDVAGWENGKKFHSGDTLVFKYSEGAHNVVVVNKSDYDSCNVPDNATTFSSGNDKVKLRKGPIYFICGIPGHCDAGMKIAINAA
ncbi:hypothetical protein RD792_004979 [Penstemon davidsonii]|uniref:Phytocyanin domain-containing protein n=1 Tax=Penstemon davidsonii TaxID=160366 RepID=A0ABR0DIW1_9LAMI|nr:hypothetical protein RD792_004979 [Penstemon davidsonii]